MGLNVASHGPQCGLTWASLWPHMGLNVASNKSQIESKMILSNDFIVFWPQSVLWFYRSHGSSWLVTSFTPSKLKLNGNTAILMNYIKIHSTMVPWSLVIGFMGNSYDMTHDDVPRRRPKTYIYIMIYILWYIYI